MVKWLITRTSSNINEREIEGEKDCYSANKVLSVTISESYDSQK